MGSTSLITVIHDRIDDLDTFFYPCDILILLYFSEKGVNHRLNLMKCKEHEVKSTDSSFIMSLFLCKIYHVVSCYLM